MCPLKGSVAVLHNTLQVASSDQTFQTIHAITRHAFQTIIGHFYKSGDFIAVERLIYDHLLLSRCSKGAATRGDAPTACEIYLRAHE